MSEVQYLYRVCLPADISPAWECLLLPGDSNRLTGYWTPHAECAREIYATRLQHCEYERGSSTYAEIYRIRADQVRIGPPAPKSGHDSEFDRDEVFVVELFAEPEVVTRQIMEALCPCGGIAFYSRHYGGWYCLDCRRAGTGYAIQEVLSHETN